MSLRFAVWGGMNVTAAGYPPLLEPQSSEALQGSAHLKVSWLTQIGPPSRNQVAERAEAAHHLHASQSIIINNAKGA